MPAGFNNGQIEYIKAIANVNGHKTYKPVKHPLFKTPITENHLGNTHDVGLNWTCFTLGQLPLVHPPGSITETTDVDPIVDCVALDAFDIPVQPDENANELQRQGAEGFLESTHLRFRCIIDNPSTGGFHSEHNEYRMIVFRHKERQHHQRIHAQNFSDWHYDLFHGTAGYKIGFTGVRFREDIQGESYYAPNSDISQNGSLWVDNQQAMTFPINKEDYVVMKDHRFFLGKEYGGKNIFETTLHWDWQDPIATTDADVTETESNKNYCWYIMILGQSNNTEGDASLNIQITGTTHMTSG